MGGDGMAVLKGYRTTALGLGLRIVTEKRQTRPASTTASQFVRPVPIAAELQFLNASEKALAIVDLPGGRAFTMEPDRAWGWQPAQDSWHWVGEKGPRPTPGADQIRVLKPGETCTVRIDFSDPVWHVAKTGTPAKPLADVEDWQARFRFVYRPPAREVLSGVPNADLLWQGRLLSRAFGGGVVD